MTERIYAEGHRPAMGWWDAAGFHAACECGWESGPLASVGSGEKAAAIHFGSVSERATIIIEQDDAVELPDEDPGASFGEFPAGY